VIKAVIFDCFGVLTIDGWLKFLDEYLPDGPKQTQAKKLNQQVDKGLIPYQDFIDRVAGLAGTSSKTVDNSISQHLPKNEQLFGYINQLKSEYKLGILSNIAVPSWFHDHFTQEELALFDDILLSSQVGLIKPDPEIFKLAAKRLNVRMDECLFIDDRDSNTEVAEGLGMQTVIYKNFEEFETDIKAILGRSG
jgi:epoxide hydrolase-like predicted phosphatase